MPTYTITDPRTGKVLRVTGDSPPTEEELIQLFDSQTVKPTDPAVMVDGQPVSLAAYNETPSRQRAPAALMVDGKPVSIEDYNAEPTLQRQNTLMERAAQLGHQLEQAKDAVVAQATSGPIGIAKGAGRTAVGLGKAIHSIPGVSAGVDKLYALTGRDIDSASAFEDTDRLRTMLGLNAANTGEKVGITAEQMAEYLIPAAAAERGAVTVAAKAAPYLPKIAQGATRLGTRMVGQGTAAATTAAAQGGDVPGSALMGTLAPPVGALASKTVNLIGDTARPLVRAHVKPLVSEMKKLPGAAYTGLNYQAEKLIDFIVKHRLTTPAKARALIDTTGAEFDDLMQTHGATVSDAPQRVMRYLGVLLKNAKKQVFRGDDARVIVSKMKELLDDSPLSEDVVTMVMKPSPTGMVTASGKPVMVPTPVTSRALRTDVTAAEALDVGRKTGQWGSVRGDYGAQYPGTVKKVEQVAERATRDASKLKVPGAAELQKRRHQGIAAEQVLQRGAYRQANRDILGLPATNMAAGEMAANLVRGKGLKLPWKAIALNWYRSNQMRLGIWAAQFEDAMARNDVRKIADIMTKVSPGLAEHIDFWGRDEEKK